MDSHEIAIALNRAFRWLTQPDNAFVTIALFAVLAFVGRRFRGLWRWLGRWRMAAWIQRQFSKRR